MEDLKEYLDKLRDNVDIVSVISRYVKLKKRGRNYVGLCPFHDEKTPSFVVSPEKQIFHCFGCGASGDVVKFIMRIEDIDFKTAVKELAKEAGIPAPRFSKTIKDNTSERNRLKEVMKLIHNFFRTQLNDGVISYLKNRGVSEQSIERFGIGFAPNNSEKLLNYAKEKSISVEELQKTGLVRSDDNGRVRAYFWNRVIIPIFDLRGDIVAFGGRIFGKGEPKYLNSPDTVLFTKGNLLYPVNIAKNGIRKKRSVIVVEGYFDALILQQEGIDNAVSSMGTSFTDAQAKLIKRFADVAYFLYDDDAAGVKGAERAVEVCSKRNLVVKIAVPFEGLDPDEIVLKYGKNRIEKMIENAEDPLVFITKAELKVESDSPQGRARVIQKLVETVSKISNKTEAYEYLKQIGNLFKIDVSALIDQYNATAKGYRRKYNRGELSLKLDKTLVAERLLTQAVIQKPEFLPIILSQLDIESFFDPEYRAIFLKAKDDIKNKRLPDPKKWDDLSEKELSIAMELALNDTEIVSEAAVSQTIESVKKDLFLRSKALELLKEFEESGNLEKIKEYNEIQRRLKGR
jgi:DNA primase